MSTATAASARERVLAAVPALKGLLAGGAAGLRPDCHVVATPVAGLLGDEAG
jgi:hypothetical protein